MDLNFIRTDTVAKFDKDWLNIVASSVFLSYLLTLHDAQQNGVRLLKRKLYIVPGN